MTEAVLTGGAAASSGVGAELARVREEQGLALSDVAQQLKFGARQLEALEQERFEALPGGTFVRGMVRAYARLLTIDAEPLLGRLADRFDAPDANSLAARYKQPVPFSDGTRRSTFVYLGASLGVLVAAGAIAWQWYSEHNAGPTRVASTPSVTPVVHPAPVAVEPVVVAKAPEKISERTPEKTPPEKSPEKVVAAKEKAAPPPQEMTVKETAVSAKPVHAGVHRIVFRCEEEAWLEVKDAAGRQLLSSLNPPGCERVVQGRGPFELVIGNASHVQVLHNDRLLDLRPHSKQDIARFTIP
jgi:cytoskeleton protein RodZ